MLLVFIVQIRVSKNAFIMGKNENIFSITNDRSPELKRKLKIYYARREVSDRRTFTSSYCHIPKYIYFNSSFSPFSSHCGGI